MNIKAKFVLVLALFAAMFCSCGTKEELFDSYNSCFVPVATSEDAASFALTPETANLMLSEVYEESFDYPAGVMFCLSCPVKCDKYYWYVTPEGYDGPITDDALSKVILKDGQNGDYRWCTPNINFYIVKSESKSKNCYFYDAALNAEHACSYDIHLVVELGGEIFHDRAVLVIHALTEEQKKEFQTGS